MMEIPSNGFRWDKTMPLNFPIGPTLDQIYATGGRSWQWNGQGWNLRSTPVIGPNSFTFGEIPPSDPVQGDMWLDSTVGSLFFYVNDGTSAQWAEITGQSRGGVSFTFGPVPPSGAIAGDIWLDSTTGSLLIYVDDGNGSPQWVEASGSGSFGNSTFAPTGSTYYASVNDYYIGVSHAGPVTVYLPTSVASGKEIVVKDESGHAGDGVHRQITIIGSAGDMIDNRSKTVLNLNNGAIQMIYRNGWRVI